MAILEELQARGTPLYAITNWNQDKFRETQARFPFLGRRSATSWSRATSGVVKPDPAIYRLLLDRNGLEAASLRVHRRQREERAGAEAVGMKAIHFTTPEALRAELAALGLL